MASFKVDQEKDVLDLTFIHVSHHDEIRQKSTQRAIRRHVMKSIGRSRRKGPQALTISINIPLIASMAPGDAHSTVPLANSSPKLPSWQHIPRQLQPTGLYPVEPDSRTLRLVHFMNNEADYLYRPFRQEWISMALLDHSAFYLSLANAALFINQMTEHKGFDYGDCLESLKYYSECLNQVTRRLGSRIESVSEGIITTVLGFICHDSRVGNWDRWAVHMEGLERIIQLRGGFEGLSRNITLFTFWYDVVGSAVYDSSPRFSVPTHIVEYQAQRGVQAPHIEALIWKLKETSFELAEVGQALERAAYVASVVNKNAHQPQFWKDAVNAAKLIGPITHYLLSMPRLSDFTRDCNVNSELLLREMVRLALLILLAGLKKAFSLISDELNPLQETFTNILRLGSRTYFLFPQLNLWAIIIATSFHQGPSRELRLAELRRAMSHLDIGTSEVAMELAKEFVWIDTLTALEFGRLSLEIDNVPNLLCLDLNALT